jgi:hypothetical protein
MNSIIKSVGFKSNTKSYKFLTLGLKILPSQEDYAKFEIAVGS